MKKLLRALYFCFFCACSTASASDIDPEKDTKLCMRPPFNHAPVSEFEKVFQTFFGSCENNADPLMRKRVCIPIAPQAEIDRLNAELKKIFEMCPYPKPDFEPPATSNCGCSCYQYHGAGINYCTDDEMKTWEISSNAQIIFP